MDRRTLKLPFTLAHPRDWTCPACEKSVLRVVKETFHSEERAHSRDHLHDAWEPEWIEYVYSCLLKCSNEDCKELVANSGTGSVDYFEYEENGEWHQSIEDHFMPQYFTPHLKLHAIPAKCPEPIVKALHESFRLFFASPSAASNSVRIAIEELLTDLKVKRYSLVKNQRRLISLHQRIGLLPAKYAPLKDLLMAIKWLGNAGSHDTEAITRDDVMDAYDLTEHVLAEIYAPKHKKLAALAKKVNKKKGPAK